MRLILYIFLIIQIFNFLGVFAEKPKDDSSLLSSVKWEKVEEKSKPLKKIIWRSYNNDESYFEDEILENKNKQKLLQIQPHIPLNNFLDNKDFMLSTFWKSTFSGGAGGGTGNQNYAVRYDFGLSDDSLFSIYLSEADDPLYQSINGKVIPNNWSSIALGYKKRIFESENFKNSLSFAGSLEYWVVSSGSVGADAKKSIYNEIDNNTGLERYEKFIYSFSFPFSREFNKRTKLTLVPGVSLIPNILGEKNIGENFYGNNLFVASGLNFNISENIELVGSYTYLFGPGNNSFNEDLKYLRKPIYSYGFNWDASPIIGIEGKVTNSYGATPSTSLLTIPSDNKPLYYVGANYKPFLEDIRFEPLSKSANTLVFGGVTVNNALFPEKGISLISLNYDDKGNLFGSYGYSLSNIFQIEISTGTFSNNNLTNQKNSVLQNIYLNESTFNYRLGGKLLILSPQKNDLFWMTLRTSLGRNEGLNHQGYMFTELINTFRVNNWLALNISPKYFFSGVESFGGIGLSSYINFSDNLMLIPEINTSVKNDSNVNSTIALRYSLSPEKSLDLYYSNSAGIQDLGQLLQEKKSRIGIKLNFLY
tara:strand:+ start:1330 stop:3102 length:1773 start_codon:yes stop_codon:yes gene_type:complete